LLSANPELQTAEPVRRMPRVMVLGVPDRVLDFNDLDLEVSKDNIVELLARYNSGLLDMEAWGAIRVVYRTKARALDSSNWVFEMPAAARGILIDKARLCLEFASCPTRDHSSVTRCFRCNGYGHISTRCTSEECCPRCTGPHRQRDCTAPVLRCSNCVKARRTDVCHSAADWSCPCYRYQLELAASRTSYA
jgi:hypothetical protein